MHIETIAILRGERESLEEFTLIVIELLPRPFDCERCDVIHVLGVSNCRRVMVAEQRYGAARHKALHGVDNEARVSAVADEITEKNIAVDRIVPSMRKTRFERFPISMNVREDRD